MRFPDRLRSRRGLTLLEVVAALTIIILFVGVAFPAYREVTRMRHDDTAKARLVGVEVELARNEVSGGFGGDLHERLRVGGVTFVDASTPSTGPRVLSVGAWTTNPGFAVVTVLAESGTCWAIRFRSDTDTVWGADPDPDEGQCMAGHAGLSTLTTGTRADPYPLDLRAP
jgi:type II secretory pathway pseudopilin PulG